MEYSIDDPVLDFVDTDLAFVDMEYLSDHTELDFVDMEQDIVYMAYSIDGSDLDFVYTEQDFVQITWLSDRIAMNIAYYCRRFSEPVTTMNTRRHYFRNVDCPGRYLLMPPYLRTQTCLAMALLPNRML